MFRILATIVLVVIFISGIFLLLGESEYKLTKNNTPFLDSNSTMKIEITDGHWEWNDLKWEQINEPKMSITKKEQIAFFSKTLSNSQRISVSNTRPDSWLTIQTVNKTGSKLTFTINENFQKIIFIEYGGAYYIGDSLIQYIHNVASHNKP